MKNWDRDKSRRAWAVGRGKAPSVKHPSSRDLPITKHQNRWMRQAPTSNAPIFREEPGKGETVRRNGWRGACATRSTERRIGVRRSKEKAAERVGVFRGRPA